MSKISICDIVEAFEFQNDETDYYIDLRTNEVFSLTSDDYRGADSDGDLSSYPEWQHEFIRTAIEVIEDVDNRFISLPSSFEINDYRIMESFCETVEDDAIKNILENAISGRGAFRRFKDSVINIGIQQKWYTYKEKAYEQIAIDWCKNHNLEYDYEKSDYEMKGE